MDVIAVQLQDSQEREVENLFIDLDQLVVREVQPGEIPRRAHDLRLEHVVEAT